MSTTNRPHLVQYSIFAIGYNSRHLYRGSKSLFKEINSLNVKNLRCYFTGSNKTEWCILEIGKLVDIHFMT